MRGAALGLANWGRIKKLQHKATYVSLDFTIIPEHDGTQEPQRSLGCEFLANKTNAAEGCLPPPRPQVASYGEKLLRLGIEAASGLAFVASWDLPHCPPPTLPCVCVGPAAWQ